MRSQKRSLAASLLLFSILMLLLPSAFGATASVTPSWESSAGIPQNKSLDIVFDIGVGTPDPTVTYLFNVSLSNSDESAADTGFNISGYDTAGAFADYSPSSVSYDPEAKFLTYEFASLPDQLSLTCKIHAVGSRIYPNESVTVRASLSTKSSDGVITEIAHSDSTVYADFRPYQLTARTALVSPTVLPFGETGEIFRINASSSLSYPSVVSQDGVGLYYLKYAVDFSDVNITADGITQTYKEWLDTGSSPVHFATPDGDILDLEGSEVKKLIYTGDGTVKFVYTLPFNFTIFVNENFTKNGSDPSVDFRTLKHEITVKVNNRSDVTYDFVNVPYNGNFDDNELFSVKTGNQQYNATGEATVVGLFNYAAGYDYIIADSEQYSSVDDPRHHFYYQELFKSNISSAVAGGDNLTVQFEIPDGVTVTHLRMPASDSAQAKKENNIDLIDYQEVFLLKNGYRYNLSQTNGNDIVLNLTGSTLDGQIFEPFKPGEDVVLQFIRIVKIDYIFSRTAEYKNYNGISFVGTTNSSVTDGKPLTFGANITASSDSSSLTKTSFSTNATRHYAVSTYPVNQSVMVTDGNNKDLMTTVGRTGDAATFYLYSHFSPSIYPYVSAHRADPMNAYNTTLYPNLVVYFRVPDQSLIIGDPEFVDLAGEPLASQLTTSQGRPIGAEKKIIDLENGERLVEIKFYDADTPTENYWLPYRNYYLRLPLTVPADFEGTTIQFENTSVLLSTWDDQVTALGSGGKTVRFEDLGFSNETVAETVASVKAGGYGKNIYPKTVSVSSDKISAVNVMVSNGSSYSYYIPGNESSIPELVAGSSGEKFKMLVVSRSNSSVEADAIFIIPQSDGREIELKDELYLDVSHLSGDLDTYLDEFSLQYTTADSFNAGHETYETVQSNNSIEWIEFDINSSDGTVSLPAGTEASDITAVRIKADSLLNSKVVFMIPFSLPPVKGKAEDMTAIGQTLYKLDEKIIDTGYTGAVRTTQTLAPVFKWNDGDAEFVLSNGADFTYTPALTPASSITPWNTVYVYDDYTADVSLSEVSVQYTPKAGGLPVTETFQSDRFETAPYTNGSNASGFSVTINDSDNFVSLNKPGTYEITYVTAPDDDLQKTTAKYSFTVTKSPSTITDVSGDSLEIVMGDSYTGYAWGTSAHSWADALNNEIFLSGKDSGVSVASEFEEKSMPGEGFNETPGVYNFVYEYTDVAGNTAEAAVGVTVKYTGQLVLEPEANGVFVPAMKFNIKTPDKNGGVDINFIHYDSSREPFYRYDLLSVVSTEPDVTIDKVNYTLSVADGLPSGLKEPAGDINGAGGIAVGLAVNPIETITFDPVRISAVIDGEIEHVLSVSLSSNETDSQLVDEKEGAASLTFAPETGAGWFDKDSYYLTLSLDPGYEITSSAPAVSGDSVLDQKTADFGLLHDDVRHTFTISESPLISGFVWADADKNSLIGESENPISGAVVELLGPDGEKIAEKTTESDGLYYFIKDDTLDNGSYFIRINLPRGFNRASAFTDDQHIDSNNAYQSDEIEIDSARQHHTVNAGFYYETSSSGGSGGSGTGSVSVKDNDPMQGAPEEL